MEQNVDLLTYHPPYDWSGMLAFLRARATPGVECVDDDSYRRTIVHDGTPGEIGVWHDQRTSSVRLEVGISKARAGEAILGRVRQIFDVDCDPDKLQHQFGDRALLRNALQKHPGVRVPGAWDGFELAVRAILGQQVSVKAASTIAGRVAARFGTPISAQPPLTRLFPTPAQLIKAPLEAAGIMSSRAETIRRLARSVMNGTVILAGSSTSAVVSQLKTVSGIGDWTAQYIAMRALGDRDAFPSGDLILRRAAGGCSARELERKSQAWRPWRAYAVMLLWRMHAETTPSTDRRGTRDVRHDKQRRGAE